MSSSKKMVLLTAPSGAGKTTIARRLMKAFPFLTFSISATTRRPRPNEKHGEDYYFFSQSEFHQLVEDGAFIEYEEVYPGRFYGTLEKAVNDIWARGLTVLFDLDVKGARNLKSIYGDRCLSLFIEPESLAVLESRLRDRQTETEETLAHRLKRAAFEIEQGDFFDFSIVNKDLDTAVAEARDRVLQFMDIYD
jgi:guanylate kinase